MTFTLWVVAIPTMRWNSLLSIYETVKPLLTRSSSTTRVIPTTALTRWTWKLVGRKLREPAGWFRATLHPYASITFMKTM